VVGAGASAQVNHPLAPSLSRRGITRSIFMHSVEPKAHGICGQHDRCQAQDGMLLAFLGKLSTRLEKTLDKLCSIW